MGKTIYLVEDNAEISELIQYILDKTGIDVTVCPTAEKFRSSIETNLPDLVILDIMLPDGNGFDICSELKSNEITRHIPVLLMSANLSNKSLFAQSAAEDFISKPFDIEDFRKKVQYLTV